MIYYSGWGKDEVEKLSISEIIDYLKEFNTIELNKMKAFAVYNLMTTRLGVNGSKDECERYLNRLQDDEQENNIDDQFNGVDFVK
jgi:uncharacterized protein (DUF2164 family)